MDLVALAPEDLRRRRQGYVGLLAVQVFFGLFPIFGKFAIGEFLPLAIVAWRIGVGALSLGAFAFLVYGRRAVPARADWPRLFLCALLGVVLNMALFLEGLKLTTAVNTALLLPLIPVFTVIVAVILRQERFDPVRAVGMAIAFTGASLVLFQKGPDLSGSYLLGNTMIVINELCYAFYLVLARPLLARYPPAVVIAWVFLLSTWSIPLLLARGDTVAIPAAAPLDAWLALAYIVVFATSVVYLLNVFALARVSASTTAAFIFLQPVITIVGSLAWLDEGLPNHLWLATALTFGGVWIVARRPIAKPLAVATREP